MPESLAVVKIPSNDLELARNASDEICGFDLLVVARLLSSPVCCREMGQQALDRVANQFSWDHRAYAIDNFYRLSLERGHVK